MQPLASACHWPSATRSIEAGLDALCDRINLPFACSIPLPTNSRQTSSFAHLHRIYCESSPDLVAANTANVIAAQLRHLSEPTVTNPRPPTRVITRRKPTRSSHIHTSQCLPLPTLSLRPPARSLSLRAESAAASAPMTAVAAAFLARSCKRDDNMKSRVRLRRMAAPSRAKAEAATVGT